MSVPVIDDRKFEDADDGIKLPARRISDGTARLEITNLDRADPPGYVIDGVPRGVSFNGNVFELDVSSMPKLKVECETGGFEPTATTPVYWRLQTLHVLGRYVLGKKKAHYGSKVVRLSDEWTGSSATREFTLFGTVGRSPTVIYDNDDGRLAGGHAILTVAARPGGAGPWLQDYVHLRIVGTNPAESDIRELVHRTVLGRGADPFELMLNAIFAWEADFEQFDPDRQTQVRYGPPGGKVVFDWPDDPPRFPVASFDFGVGISQYTHPGSLRTDYAWQWDRNVGAGINVFFEALAASFKPNIGWDAWAMEAWRRYNGSGEKAEAYARARAASPDGSAVPHTLVPRGFDLAKATAPIGAPAAPRPKWPVTKSENVEVAAANVLTASVGRGSAALADAASLAARDRGTLAWMWPRVVADAHAREKRTTNVLPGLDHAGFAATFAGLDTRATQATLDHAFDLAWHRLAPPGELPAGGVTDEWRRLTPFVRENIGEGRLSDFAAVRDLLFTAFGAPDDPRQAIVRINKYYEGFVDAALTRDGPTIKVHPEMKDRIDDARTLLGSKGATGEPAKVRSIGGLNIRANANNARALSNHSFGLAIDLDPLFNPNLPLRRTRDERANWAALVKFITGVDPYGEESERLRVPRPYSQTLVDVLALRTASEAFVGANSSAAKLLAALKAAFQSAFELDLSDADLSALTRFAAPAHPEKSALIGKLAELKVPAAARELTASTLIYGQAVFFEASNKKLKPSVIGTAATTARFGFLDLPPEVVAALGASEGGKLRWLGSATGTKDYMHFDFHDGEHPPLF